MYILRTPYPHISHKRSITMKITTKQVGTRMREARKKKKYTLRYLANKIGLSSGSTISNWELGLNLPNKRYLKKNR